MNAEQTNRAVLNERKRMQSPHLLQGLATIHTIIAKAKKSFPVLTHVLLGLFLAACASFPSESLREHGFETRIIPENDFLLYTLVREKEKGAPWLVYIEGDGHAWTSRTQPSQDPTPRNPVALYLALHDTAPNRLYLARPCQYVTNATCEQKYWTTHRFAPVIIDTLNTAIDRITGDAPKQLIGYSGGGAVAALLAVRRQDVSKLTTYAGNMDIDAFTTIHHVTPLSGSLNPMNIAPHLKEIPQIHYVGSEDSVIPVSLVKGFIKAQGENNCAQLVVVNGASHSDLVSLVQSGKNTSIEATPCK